MWRTCIIQLCWPACACALPRAKTSTHRFHVIITAGTLRYSSDTVFLWGVCRVNNLFCSPGAQPKTKKRDDTFEQIFSKHYNTASLGQSLAHGLGDGLFVHNMRSSSKFTPHLYSFDHRLGLEGKLVHRQRIMQLTLCILWKFHLSRREDVGKVASTFWGNNSRLQAICVPKEVYRRCARRWRWAF